MKRNNRRTRTRGFTLIELLVVIAIIAILAAILFPVFSRARETARAISCTSNLKQIGLGMMQYAQDTGGLFPMAAGDGVWGVPHTSPPTPGFIGWMEQIYPYTKSQQIYRCASDSDSEFSYFMSAKAAHVANGNSPAPVDERRIDYPTAFVLAGDTFSSAGGGGNTFKASNTDKDDYQSNCVGGPIASEPWMKWKRHNEGQNILFADGHVKKFNRFDPGQMTFRYDEMHGWE